MCTNMRYITNKFTGNVMFVKCGKCPACLQEKSLHYAGMVSSMVLNGYVPIMVTLTYRNDVVPCIPESSIYHDGGYYAWIDGDYVLIPFSRRYNLHQLPKLRGSPESAIGILYYKHLQNFIKRFRTHFERLVLKNTSYEIEDTRIFHFSIGEYGETFARPHFHSIIFVKSSLVSFAKSAARACWPYDDGSTTRFAEVVTKGISSYVSTYMCSLADLHPFYSEKEIRSRNLHSIRFGYKFPEYDFQTVVKQFYSHQLYFLSSSTTGDTSTDDCVIIPESVVSRYFPRIKGYSKLAIATFEDILRTPAKLFSHSYELGYVYRQKIVLDDGTLVKLKQDDLQTNMNLIENTYSRVSHLISRAEWAYIGSRIWFQLAQTKLGFLYRSIQVPLDNFYAYDNLYLFNDNFFNKVLAYDEFNQSYSLEDTFDFNYQTISPSLVRCYMHLSTSEKKRLVDDPNFYPSRVRSTERLTDMNINSRKLPKTTERLRSLMHKHF